MNDIDLDPSNDEEEGCSKRIIWLGDFRRMGLRMVRPEKSPIRRL